MNNKNTKTSNLKESWNELQERKLESIIKQRELRLSKDYKLWGSQYFNIIKIYSRI